jgi:hypothetical protein
MLTLSPKVPTVHQKLFLKFRYLQLSGFAPAAWYDRIHVSETLYAMRKRRAILQDCQRMINETRAALANGEQARAQMAISADYRIIDVTN